ncbi:effector-associated constant component EACC1 [Streptomyces sp. NBC_00500]|uniref:effector-associated constant component EACC1 n=1 Tax=Streptomyces sp. NBC_00500 TaxID=2975762 RepID=UPI0030E1B659
MSEQAEIRSLREHLRRNGHIDVEQHSGAPGPGELGIWDFLQVTAASGGVLVVAIRTLPEFIRSRRTDVSVTVKTNDREFVITAANADDALRLIDEALHG